MRRTDDGYNAYGQFSKCFNQSVGFSTIHKSAKQIHRGGGESKCNLEHGTESALRAPSPIRVNISVLKYQLPRGRLKSIASSLTTSNNVDCAHNAAKNRWISSIAKPIQTDANGSRTLISEAIP
jgi:hypothetical protein